MFRATPSANASGAIDYYSQAISRSDYYLNDKELACTWSGSLAEQLGLTGQVKAEDFAALCNNRLPNGEKLTPRDDEGRTVLYDI